MVPCCSQGSCETSPTPRCRSERCTRPSSLISSPRTAYSRLDLPQPTGPITPTTWPWGRAQTDRQVTHRQAHSPGPGEVHRQTDEQTDRETQTDRLHTDRHVPPALGTCTDRQTDRHCLLGPGRTETEVFTWPCTDRRILCTYRYRHVQLLHTV